MSYRPITDMWILARAKLKDGKKYYGAYPGGFLERARRLVGATVHDPVLHICSGMVKYYPYEGGFGKHDLTLDMDPKCEPDYLQDALQPFPKWHNMYPWRAILIDPPYTEDDAENYFPGKDKFPKVNKLLQNAADALMIGGKVGVLHYVLPKPPKELKFVACVGVVCGFNNRIRCFSVFERISLKEEVL